MCSLELWQAYCVPRTLLPPALEAIKKKNTYPPIKPKTKPNSCIPTPTFGMKLLIPDQLSLSACGVGTSAHMELSGKRCCQNNPGQGLVLDKSTFLGPVTGHQLLRGSMLCRASIANSENQDYGLFSPAAFLGAGVHRRPQLWRTAL